jgi:hypothetical protein
MDRRCIAVLLVAALAAGAEGPPQDWEYSVTRDGQPAAGVKVGLAEITHELASGPRTSPERSATTDAKGAFRLPRVDQKAIARVLARDASGRAGMGNLWQDNKSPATLELARPVELKARVTDGEGKPIPGLKLVPEALGPEDFAQFGRPWVNAETPDWFWEGFAPKVAADGTVTLSGVPSGSSAALRFEAPGYGRGRLWLMPGHTELFQLGREGSVTIRFPAPPDARASVLAKLTRKYDASYREATAEGTAKAGGELTLRGLPPGTYEVSFPYPGPVGLYAKAVTPVAVGPGAKVVADAPLESGVRVTACLVESGTGKGVAEAAVWASVRRSTDSVHVPEIKAGADGKVELTVPAGKVALTPVAADGYKVLPFGSEQFNRYSTAFVPLKPGESRDFGRFALIRTVDLHGTVVDPDGKAVAGAKVQTSGANFPTNVGQVVSDRQGRFVIRGLSPEGGVIGVTARTGNQITAKPLIADPTHPETELRIVVSERFGARVRARAVDRAGQPVAGAKVQLGVMTTYVHIVDGASGGGLALQVAVTGPDGRFQSEVIQAGDEYTVTFSAPGYRGVTGPAWRAVAGQVHDFGDLQLTGSDRTVTGTVADLAGRPVAGAVVFDNADGLKPTSAATDAAGRFTLGGLLDGPAFVSVKADGFRVISVPAEAGGKPVAVVLRRQSDPPAPPPAISAAHRAASAKLARHLLERMWAERLAAKDDGRQILSAMARLDFETAKRWADEEKAREGGKDLSGLLDQAGGGRRLADVAREDPDEAVALLRSATGVEGFQAVRRLAERLLPDAPEAAARLAEEVVLRARGMEPMHRTWSLAAAGELVYRTGRKDVGRKLIDEAAAQAERLGTNEFDGYNRGMVACRLALYDPARARRLIDSIQERYSLNRFLTQACIRLADVDLPLAKRWLDELRPGSRDSVSRRIADRLALRAPDEAVALVEGISDATYRVPALAEFAARMRSTDRDRAFRLFERLLDEIAADRTGQFRQSGSGGAATALVLYRAKQAGHPDLASVRDRVLAARSRRPESPFQQNHDPNTQTAVVLALTDPDTAKMILDRFLPPGRIKDPADRFFRETVIALALADPAGLDPKVDALVAEAARAKEGFQYGPLADVAAILTDPEILEQRAVRYADFFGGSTEE